METAVMPTKVDPQIEEVLAEVETKSLTPTLSELIREGSTRFRQANGWGDGVNSGCALTAALVVAKERRLV